MLKRNLLVFSLILGGVFLGTLLGGSQIQKLLSGELPVETNLESKTQNTFKKIKVGNKELKVEVVNDEDSLRKGLSNRDQIGSDGMLFVLSTEQKAVFWMKDMKFDLDMIWIKSGQVIEITKNVLRPNEKDSNLTLYSSQKPISQVLEVRAGDSEKYGITVGDIVTLME